MRVGIFGGTFDPIHIVHLIVAEQCRDQARLEQVWLIPAFNPPHKQDRSVASFGHRTEMIRLAIAGYPAFQVDELEKDRGGLSYTADTLEELGRRHPQADLHFIIGSDCLPDLPHWHEPARIAAAASLVIVARPGWEVWPPERIQHAFRLPPEGVLRHQIVQTPQISLCSTELRQRVAAGRTIRYLVPRSVECYIDTHHLYRDS